MVEPKYAAIIVSIIIGIAGMIAFITQPERESINNVTNESNFSQTYWNISIINESQNISIPQENATSENLTITVNATIEDNNWTEIAHNEMSSEEKVGFFESNGFICENIHTRGINIWNCRREISDINSGNKTISNVVFPETL